MKIEGNYIKYTDFSSIQCGECFACDGDYYMKVCSEDYNAISFSDNYLRYFYDKEKVIPIKAKVVFE